VPEKNKGTRIPNGGRTAQIDGPPKPWGAEMGQRGSQLKRTKKKKGNQATIKATRRKKRGTTKGTVVFSTKPSRKRGTRSGTQLEQKKKKTFRGGGGGGQPSTRQTRRTGFRRKENRGGDTNNQKIQAHFVKKNERLKVKEKGKKRENRTWAMEKDPVFGFPSWGNPMKGAGHQWGRRKEVVRGELGQEGERGKGGKAHFWPRAVSPEKTKKKNKKKVRRKREENN